MSPAAARSRIRNIRHRRSDRASAGFGTMRLTGPGIWDEPVDRAECVAVVRRAVELGVDLIDTADSYGPAVSEDIIGEALHPYPSQVLIASKAGLVRTGPDAWFPVARPGTCVSRQKCHCAGFGWTAFRCFSCIASMSRSRSRTRSAPSSSFGTRARSRPSVCPRSGSRRSKQARAITPDRHGAEPLQPHPPTVGARRRLLRGERHRVHSVVSDRGRAPGSRGRPPRSTWCAPPAAHPLRSRSRGCSRVRR